MATIAKGPLEPYNPPPGWAIRRFKVDAAATFKRGAIVVLDADGELAEGGADPTNIWGIADADAAQKDAESKIPVILPYESILFVGNLGGASVTALTDLGKGYGVVKEGDNWHVDKTDVVAKRVAIEDFDRRDTIGDTNGRVIVKFLAAQIAHTAGL